MISSCPNFQWRYSKASRGKGYSSYLVLSNCLVIEWLPKVSVLLECLMLFIRCVTVFMLFDLILFLIFRLVLSCVFLILPLLFSFFSTSPSKITPLESGFVPLDESSSHFSNQFFIVLVIFVIFDLEVVLSICVICLSLNSWFF